MSLLTVVQVQDWVPQAAGEESLIADAIEMAEALADAYCDRGLAAGARTETYDIGDGQGVGADGGDESSSGPQRIPGPTRELGVHPQQRLHPLLPHGHRRRPTRRQAQGRDRRRHPDRRLYAKRASRGQVQRPGAKRDARRAGDGGSCGRHEVVGNGNSF